VRWATVRQSVARDQRIESNELTPRTADHDSERRHARRMRGLWCWLVVGALATSAGCGGSDRPARFWTVEEAEAIRAIRGTPLRTTDCRGVGKSRDSADRRFSCVGTIVLQSLPQLPVLVRYVLNPRGGSMVRAPRTLRRTSTSMRSGCRRCVQSGSRPPAHRATTTKSGRVPAAWPVGFRISVRGRRAASALDR
jgi:hypothetical protein